VQGYENNQVIWTAQGDSKVINQLTGRLPELAEESVLHFMGYQEADEATGPVIGIVREQLENLSRFSDYWGAALEVPIQIIEKDRIQLRAGDGNVWLTSTQIPTIVRNCKSVVILLVTAGQDVSNESQRLWKGADPLPGFVLDAVASAMAVELMKTLTHQVFKGASKRQLGTTLRVGPGYTGWNIEDQAGLFSCFADQDIPVSLNSSMVMEPQKSLLGLVGLTPDGKQAKEIEPCRICDFQNCRMRKAVYRGYPKQGGEALGH
jgi:hypothetical protein